MLRVLALLFCAAASVAPLPAHGGRYVLGPQPPPAPPPPTWQPRQPIGGRIPAGGGGPTVPGPASGAAATGVGVPGPGPMAWETWWEFNKEPFLHRRAVVVAPPVSGSDDFYLGARRPEARVDVLAPNVLDRRERIVPALAGLLARERNRDIVTACLVGLGKVGEDGPGVELEAALAAHLGRDDQEVRETAALSLGIAGRPRALPTLAALLRDDAEGRRLEQRTEVRARTRAFAAYGLGLIARRSDDGALKQQVAEVLLGALDDPEADDRDLRVAIVSALGILAFDDGVPAQKRLLWQTVDALTAFFEKDLGGSEEPVQAHAPIAIGRLLGRGQSHLHRQARERFAAVLTARRDRRDDAVLRSAAIALGMLARPPEDCPEDEAAAAALQRTYEKGRDQDARYYALIALGRIGGADNREYLLRAYQRGRKGTERPWAALALGVQAFAGGTIGESDTFVAQLLLDDLQEASDRSLRGALAVAVGLTGHAPATPVLLRMLREHEGEQHTAGHLCIGLALLADRAAVPQLGAVLGRSVRRPVLLRQCATALGGLGDRDASVRLTEMMADGDSVAVLAALASAIGRIGDRRAIGPLLDMLGDRELTKLARAFVAAALGGIGDKDELPWSTPLSVDSNHSEAVDTLTNGMTGVLDIL